MFEGAVSGREGAGVCGTAGAGVRMDDDDGPNRDMVLLSGRVGAGAGAGVRMDMGLGARLGPGARG